MLFAVIYAARDVTEEKDKRSLNLFRDPSTDSSSVRLAAAHRKHAWRNSSQPFGPPRL